MYKFAFTKNVVLRELSIIDLILQSKCKIMRRRMMLLLTCCIMGVGLVMAQSSKVTGKVLSDEDGEANGYPRQMEVGLRNRNR